MVRSNLQGLGPRHSENTHVARCDLAFRGVADAVEGEPKREQNETEQHVCD